MSEQRKFMPNARLDDLLAQLTRAGFQLIGPQLQEGAIVYRPMTSVAELPLGVRDSQAPGRYRAARGEEGGRWFAWANGPQALKPLTFAPREPMWRAVAAEGRLHFAAVLPEMPPTAVIGVRACDLAALAIQDRHFADEPAYQARRRQLLLVAVNCSHPAATCFCASTGDGPAASSGYDLLLDELDEGFVVAAGSEAGAGILALLNLTDADPTQLEEAAALLGRAAAVQQRTLPAGDLAATLFARLDHLRWDEVAQRCLACANCTQVCPTCFCHSHQEVPALDGSHSEHYREWDSCFSEGHSYIHGFKVRPDIRTRYRQWLTHKLGGWQRQFGRSGCVGCGRCITWCPAGIDITEEARAICAGEP